MDHRELLELARSANVMAEEFRRLADERGEDADIALPLTQREGSALSFALFLVYRDYGNDGRGFTEGEVMALWQKVQRFVYQRDE